MSVTEPVHRETMEVGPAIKLDRPMHADIHEAAAVHDEPVHRHRHRDYDDEDYFK